MFARFKSERDPAAARADLALMVAALNVSELGGVMHGARSNAPQGDFEATVDLARSAIGAERWAHVEERLPGQSPRTASASP